MDLLFSLLLCYLFANLEFNSAHDIEISAARVYYTVIYISCQYLNYEIASEFYNL